MRNLTTLPMLWFYRLAFLPALLLATPYYVWRMRRRGGYGARFGDRFGNTPALPPKRSGVRRIWLQAVSVGEMLAIEPVLTALAADPSIEVYLTTTTSTGYGLAVERYAGRAIGIGYFPLDAWPTMARAWGRISPDLVILTEGERWPELLAQARARRVPVVSLNARMSDRSFRRLQSVRFLVPSLLRGITRLLPASPQDAERFRAIGFPAERMVITGNIKLDVPIVPIPPAELAALRASLGFGPDDLVLLGSSTWPGEEATLLAAWTALRRLHPTLKLLLVPRHAERRGELAGLFASGEYRHHFRSRGAAPGPMDVVVADTTGELRRLTQLATVVFVGKSLAPHHEGQTPVEAAALGRPVVFGERMTNFRTIAQELVAAGAARPVASASDVESALGAILADPALRASMGAAGLRWHESNRGAVDRSLAVVRKVLATPEN